MNTFVQIFFIVFLAVSIHAREKSTLHILALVPMVQGNETTLPVENWRRGWEMIPGANLAVNMINNDSTILQNTFLKLITINSNADHSFDSLVDFMRVSTNKESNYIIAIIGMFFDKEIEIFSPLADKFNISLRLSTSMSPKVFNRERFPQQFHMVQSTSVLVRALFSLMNFYNWTGPSIITSGSDPLFMQIAEEIHATSKQYSDITIENLIHFFGRDSDDTIFNQLKSNLIILSMNIRNAVNLICTAHSKNLIWPKYAWIILGHSVDDFKSHAATMNIRSSSTVDILTEGIIFIQQHLTVQDHDLKLISGLTYNNLSRLLQHRSLIPKVNPYAYVLHDAIWTVALALNESNDTDISATLNDIDFSGASGPVKFMNNEREGLGVKILQIRDTIITSLGYFINDNLTITKRINDFKEIKIGFIHSTSILYVTISYCSVALCTIFTTLVLISYLYFRDKEAIKATSTLLSMTIFFSCYLTFFYLSLLSTISLPQYRYLPDNFKKFVCFTQQWLNGLAISAHLAIAVMIVKMIRVYRIFKVSTNKKCQSNSILFLQIFLILMPNLVILTIWSATDAYRFRRYSRITDSRETIILEICDSDHLALWTILCLLYGATLMIFLMIIAVKTRKIRYKNFKDTKKINALIFVLISTISITLSYWLVLRAMKLKDTVLDHVVLHIGHILGVYELMGFLFVPKIYPLMKEKWFAKCSND